MKHKSTAMKIVSMFLFVLLINSVTLFAQTSFSNFNYAVYYDFSGQTNKTDTASIIKEKMMLLLGTSSSEYLSYNKYISDSMRAEQSKNPKMVNGVPMFSAVGIPRPKVNHVIKKDLSASKLTFLNLLGTQTVYYTDSLALFNWSLADGEKQILNYRCQKATTHFSGRDYTVWYAADIPVSDGPYKFNGLPGLIMEVRDSEGQYSFTATGIQQTPGITLIEPIGSRSKKLKDRNEYAAAFKRFKNDPSPFFQVDGISLSPEMIEMAAKRAKDALKLQNNPMELNEN